MLRLELAVGWFERCGRGLGTYYVQVFAGQGCVVCRDREAERGER